MTNHLLFFEHKKICLYHAYNLPSKQNVFVPPATHKDMYEILFVKEGLCHHCTNEDFFDVETGNMLLIDINTLHHINISSEKTYDRYSLKFNPNILPKGSDFLLSVFSPQKATLLSNTALKNVNVKTYFEKMEAWLNSKAQRPEFILTACIIELLYELYALPLTDENHKPSTQLNHLTKLAIAYINEHHSQNISVQEIAEALFISVDYLSHMFSKDMGIPIKNYITKEKMRLAKLKLVNLGLSPAETAQQLGYKSYNVFYKNYVKTYNEPPTTTKK